MAFQQDLEERRHKGKKSEHSTKLYEGKFKTGFEREKTGGGGGGGDCGSIIHDHGSIIHDHGSITH